MCVCVYVCVCVCQEAMLRHASFIIAGAAPFSAAEGGVFRKGAQEQGGKADVSKEIFHAALKRKATSTVSSPLPATAGLQPPSYLSTQYGKAPGPRTAKQPAPKLFITPPSALRDLHAGLDGAGAQLAGGGGVQGGDRRLTPRDAGGGGRGEGDVGMLQVIRERGHPRETKKGNGC